jgi:hypothetical protein
MRAGISWTLPIAVSLALYLSIASSAQAQQPSPHLGYVFPAGGRQGTTLEVTVGGQNLDSAGKVLVSGGGVQARVLRQTKPLTPQEVQKLRNRLQELRKSEKDAAAAKELLEIRKKLAAFAKRPNPAIAETVTVQVTIQEDAEPGQRELRLTAAAGLSSPLAFHVGQLPEVCRHPPKESEEPANSKDLKRRPQPPSTTPRPEIQIALPAVVNGQIMPGAVDRYRFRAKKGQRLVVTTSARELIPYLADAVPGWFQAATAIYDAGGHELAYDDHYRFHPDPVLICKIPKDGQYVLEIKDSLYRGREDFIYRIAIGEIPFVTSIFPLGGPAGTQTTVKIQGYHLPAATLSVDAADKAPGTIPLTVTGRGLVSNPVPFAVDTLPECMEEEPNNDQAAAERVTLPVIVNGRIGKPGDWDVYAFEGRAGQEIVAEVNARRLDSPLDSVLRLTDAGGRQIALNDDHLDKGSGLNTHHADSLITAKLPADGAYYLHLGDTQHQGGPAYGYRLRISEPRPDFALRVVPSSINTHPGAATPITVYALRSDGFSGEIGLALKDAPKGFALSGARIPAGQDQVRLTLTAPPDPLDEPVRLSLEGRGTLQGRPLRRLAVPADDMMQAFIYRHLVPAQSLMLAVTGKARPKALAVLLSRLPVKLPAGGTASVRLPAPRGPLLDQIQFSLSEPPEGISIQSVTRGADGITVLLPADAGKVKPGLEGNLIVDAFTEVVPNAAAGKRKPNRRHVPLGTLPAIPFEIVAPKPKSP